MIELLLKAISHTVLFILCLIFLTFILVVVFLLLVLTILVSPAILAGMYMWMRPVILALASKFGYWLTWKDVKRLTGMKSISVITILNGLAVPGGSLECRYRDVDQVRKLGRRLRCDVPEEVYPEDFKQTCMFEYRLKVNQKSGKKIKKPKEKISILQPVRVWNG